ADAIRFGGIGNLTNNSGGSVNGGSAVGYTAVDAVHFMTTATGAIVNNGNGSISGDRHAIHGETGSFITVANNGRGVITGRSGSGVILGGSGSVTNFGTITGAFDSASADTSGIGGFPDGQPDGAGVAIDIDGQATIVNHGTLQGTGAGGHAADGLPN